MHQSSLPLTIYHLADNMTTALGSTTTAHLNALRTGQVGMQMHDLPSLFPTPVCCAKITPTQANEWCGHLIDRPAYTHLEQLFIYSIEEALTGSGVDLRNQDTVLILATTKGNIDVLEGKAGQFPPERVQLNALATAVGGYFGYNQAPIVVCNACISGVLALDVAKRYLRAGQYRHAVIAGGDLVTEFTLSGFQSFKAMSDTPCRPFDRDRQGINLGEGVGTMILSTEYESDLVLEGSASANDANHISGPSRTGEGLYLAIQKTLEDAQRMASEMDYLCVHGTATPYNDEMEAKALARATLTATPFHSLKGYLGHTLGAAGLLESIVAIQALKHNELYPSMGFEHLGVSVDLNPIQHYQKMPLRTCLKTASGFGGCNAAVIFHQKTA